MKIESKISRGKDKGIPLYPHCHMDGFYVVSETRFEKDYIKVRSLAEVYDAIKSGLKLRMSNPAHARAPRLISPVSIMIDGHPIT